MKTKTLDPVEILRDISSFKLLERFDEDKGTIGHFVVPKKEHGNLELISEESEQAGKVIEILLQPGDIIPYHIISEDTDYESEGGVIAMFVGLPDNREGVLVHEFTKSSQHMNVGGYLPRAMVCLQAPPEGARLIVHPHKNSEGPFFGEETEELLKNRHLNRHPDEGGLIPG